MTSGGHERHKCQPHFYSGFNPSSSVNPSSDYFLICIQRLLSDNVSANARLLKLLLLQMLSVGLLNFTSPFIPLINVRLRDFFSLNCILDKLISSSSLKREPCIIRLLMDRSITSSMEAFLCNCSWVIGFEKSATHKIISRNRINHMTDIAQTSVVMQISKRCQSAVKVASVNLITKLP